MKCVLTVKISELSSEVFMHLRKHIKRHQGIFEILKINFKLLCVLNDTAFEDGQTKNLPYQELIGSLLLLTNCTRPSIQF